MIIFLIAWLSVAFLLLGYHLKRASRRLDRYFREHPEVLTDEEQVDLLESMYGDHEGQGRK